MISKIRRFSLYNKHFKCNTQSKLWLPPPIGGYLLTCTVQSISIQHVACPTAAFEATKRISAIMFTPSIGSIAFIDIYKEGRTSTTKIELLSKWNSSTLQHTLTREAIACESYIASTVIATICVTAGSIIMTHVVS